jgi:probable phosphoglycerate mutase
MSPSSIIYIVRHGETDYNVKHITQGHTDSQLSGNGIKQAESLAEIFKDIQFDIVYSSDLSRAKKTAEIIIRNKNLSVNTSELLRERCYGQYDGRPSSIFINENKEMFERIKTLSKLELRKLKFAQDIESDEEINNRMVTFLKGLNLTDKNQTILITTHGGIMRAFLNHLDFNGEEDLKSGSIKNTGYFKIITDGTNFTVEETSGIER